MKYTSIMNFNSLNRSLSKAGPMVMNRILDLQAEVSEKIHGENFRVGIDESGKTFIGQRNGTFYTIEEHPNWNRMNTDAQNTVRDVLTILVASHELYGKSVVCYGELCGNGMQSGFTYPWDGLSVVYFDIAFDGAYWDPSTARKFYDRNEIPYIPVYHESMTVRDALTLDVNNMPSLLSNESHIEGVVVKPHDLTLLDQLWKFESRFIVKHKSDNFSEMSTAKTRTLKVVYDSPFVDFITEARIEHAIQAIEEREPNTIKGEMADMRFIIHEVVSDVEREENDGNPLPKDDRKSVTKAVPKVYQMMLNLQVKESLGL